MLLITAFCISGRALATAVLTPRSFHLCMLHGVRIIIMVYVVRDVVTLIKYVNCWTSIHSQTYTLCQLVNVPCRE